MDEQTNYSKVLKKTGAQLYSGITTGINYITNYNNQNNNNIYSNSIDNSNNSNIKQLANEKILQIGNHLNGILSDKKIDLEPPTLVTVGSQSSGKSTVLNRIVEMNIMPMGKNMVTRTPLYLQLTQITNTNSQSQSQSQSSNEEYLPRAEFGSYHDGIWRIEKKILLVNEYEKSIREEIENQTIKKAGNGMGISTNPIILKIFDINVPNLSLVDLPGLTMVACEDRGQPADIKNQIRNMVSDYIKNDRAIILLVMPARTDLEVDLAFDLAKEYDPDGKRTVGVITKIDLMNNGTDISDYLEGRISKSLQLNYGYYAIKNQSQSNSHSYTQSLFTLMTQSEKDYFNEHPIYKSMSNERLGINNLILNLSKILIEHIRCSLPDILRDIYQIEHDVDKQLEILGGNIPENKTTFIHQLVSDFSKNFMSALNDKGNRLNLNYGRKLKDIFINYRKELDEINFIFSEEMINNAIKNCDGNHMLSIPSIEILEYCLKNKDLKPFNEFWQPSKKCVQQTIHLLSSLCNDLISNDNISRFPNLINKIKKIIVNDMIRLGDEQCRIEIKNLIAIEENYIWTNSKIFENELEKFYKNLKFNNLNINIFQGLLNSYYNTVIETFKDQIPKKIMYFLVTYLENDIYKSLYNRIIDQDIDSIDLLLKENNNVAIKRNNLNIQKTQLVNIRKIIDNHII
jgi:hypothetical protein